MLSNSEIQRLRRLVELAPHMTLDQQRALLDVVRKLKAAEGEGLPASATKAMTDVVDDKLMSEIVKDLGHGPGEPGWIKRERSEPVVRGSGWQSPPKPEDRSRQFAQFDAMVAAMVGGPNEPVK